MAKSYTFRNLRMQNWECCGENPKIPAKDILVSTYVGDKLRNMIKSYATKVAKSYNDIDDGGLSDDESDGTSWIYENTKPSTFKALPKQADEDFRKGNTHGSPYLNFHAYVAKYKGELPKAKAQFYYCLVNLGVFCDNATTWNSFQFPVLEVITPYDKGFEYFAKTIKANLFKINLKTVTKTKIVNEFPRKKKATASASAPARKFKFKDGSIITAATVEEAIAKHKVQAAGGRMMPKPEPIDISEESPTLIKNGFKIKVNKYNGHIYAEKRMPGHKDIFADINKTQKGKFEVVCYVEDTSNSVTDCVYESDLREINCTKKTLKDAFVTVNTYFKLVERCINLHKKYKEDMKELNNEAYNLNN